MKSLQIPIPAIGFCPPVYYCKKNNKKFSLDGNMDKDFWTDIPFSEEFRDIEGDIRPKPRFSTRVKMCWDDDNLYIAAKLVGNEIWAHQTAHDSVIFYDNDFEIFIDPDSDTQEYIEYEMNARNTNWDLLLTKAYRDLGSPINSLELKGLRSAVKIDGELNNPSADNHEWSVEVVIPFTSLNECNVTRKKPTVNDYYRVNFSRVQWKVDIENNEYVKRKNPLTGEPLPEDNWVWAPTGVINIHYPELWGFLFFTEKETDKPNIPEVEIIKWNLRLLYYAEHIHFELYRKYTNSLDKLMELLEIYSPCRDNKNVAKLDYKIETTNTLFEISLPFHDTIVSIYSDGKTKQHYL